jgi:acyl-CoA reductase-like NAD-dependent aldehyde dehydrogenase
LGQSVSFAVDFPNANDVTRGQPGSWFEPTMIAGLDPRTSRVATEEIFGPVVTVHKFKSADDAIDIHNTVKYGMRNSTMVPFFRKEKY